MPISGMPYGPESRIDFRQAKKKNGKNGKAVMNGPMPGKKKGKMPPWLAQKGK